ncbi:DNA polymerase, Y-family, little finger domain protein, partial [Nannochloropsis gaditana]
AHRLVSLAWGQDSSPVRRSPPPSLPKSMSEEDSFSTFSLPFPPHQPPAHHPRLLPSLPPPYPGSVHPPPPLAPGAAVTTREEAARRLRRLVTDLAMRVDERRRVHGEVGKGGDRGQRSRCLWGALGDNARLQSFAPSLPPSLSLPAASPHSAHHHHPPHLFLPRFLAPLLLHHPARISADSFEKPSYNFLPPPILPACAFPPSLPPSFVPSPSSRPRLSFLLLPPFLLPFLPSSSSGRSPGSRRPLRRRQGAAFRPLAPSPSFPPSLPPSLHPSLPFGHDECMSRQFSVRRRCERERGREGGREGREAGHLPFPLAVCESVRPWG